MMNFEGFALNTIALNNMSPHAVSPHLVSTHQMSPHAVSAHSMSLGDISFSDIIDFSDYGALFALLHNSVLAGALLGLVGGLVGVFVMMRDLSFAVHGISELSFAGAALFLLLGYDVVAGSVVGSLTAALLFGALGTKARERSSIIGVLMPFGLGLGVLFLALYKGRGANKFGLLTGQIVSVDDPGLVWLAAISVAVLIALAIVWRPLLFATIDPEVALLAGSRCVRSHRFS